VTSPELFQALPADVREFGERWLAAWASRSPARIAALCSDDVLWEDPALAAPARGRAAVEQLLAETFRAFPDLTFELTDAPCLSADGERAAVAWLASATMTGPLEPPGLAPTGRRFRIEGVDLYDLRAGELARMRTRYDVLDLLRQLGLAPARGATSERLLLALQRGAVRVLRARGGR
jgi:steroid delta-isomerase-like uncharacterized protein